MCVLAGGLSQFVMNWLSLFDDFEHLEESEPSLGLGLPRLMFLILVTVLVGAARGVIFDAVPVELRPV
jgi:hypothetical protein